MSCAQRLASLARRGGWFAVVLCASVAGASESPTPKRPNIVLVFADDIGPDLSCYGCPAVRTPHLDSLAAAGVRYENVFCTAPSCTPSRNAIATGVYQTQTGTQDQRVGGVKLPEGVRPFPQLLRDAGYHTALGCSVPGYSNKTDFNFTDPAGFDAKDWRDRPRDEPFFAQITLFVTHRNPGDGWEPVRKASPDPVDPASVELPPYLPDTPACRRDWAAYLDTVEAMDRQLGEILARLESEGIADETAVLFVSDNGRCHLRGKCWLYDAGLRVPLVARYPKSVAGPRPGTVDRRLVSALDIPATILWLAGVKEPPVFQGEPLLGPDAGDRTEVFAARDLIDEVRDPIRAIRTDRYKYIRNYAPENGYHECLYVRQNRPMLPVMRRMGSDGLLNEAQQLVLRTRKPDEELYDLRDDPHEVKNLAGSAAHGGTLKDLRGRLYGWIASTQDRGLALWESRDPKSPASPATYLADLRAEFDKQWPKNRRVNIVFHGHSVPSGYFRGGTVRPFDSYPHLTAVAIAAEHTTSVVSAIVTGVGGEQSERGAARFAADVLAKKPDVVTIDYALNDRAIGLERARAAWESMIRQAKEAGVRVILLTPSADSTAKLDDPNDPLVQHAAQIRRLAAEHGVGLVDSLGAFQAAVAAGTPLDKLLSQANHPNRRGHELIANKLAEWF